MLTPLLVTAALAAVAAPLLAARMRTQRDAQTPSHVPSGDAVPAANTNVEPPAPAAEEPPPKPYEPPVPPPPPPPPPEPPPPNPTVAFITTGAKALAAVLLATPLAPLSPFIGVLGSILGMLANENEKAKHAQPRLREAIRQALHAAEYEGYMGAWNEGARLWQLGLYADARGYFESAPEAGRARRLEVAVQIDTLNVESYRAWMAKPHALRSAEDWCRDGYLLGDGGYTGMPVQQTEGMWSYRHEADGLTRRYHWMKSHPAYSGEVVPPLSPEESARQFELQLKRQAELDLQRSEGPGALSNNIKSGDVDPDTGKRPVRSYPYPPTPPPPPPPPPPPVKTLPDPPLERDENGGVLEPTTPKRRTPRVIFEE